MEGSGDFLEGYKKANIAQHKVSLDFHWGEILRLLEKMTKESFDEEDGNIQRIFELASQAKDDEMIEKCIKLGEAIKSFIQWIHKDRQDILQNENLRAIIGHYLEMVEKIGDGRMVKIAAEIGKIIEVHISPPTTKKS